MKKFELRQIIREEISKVLNENEKTTIELYQGTKLVGPTNKKSEALKLKAEIESAMKSAFKAAKGAGSESSAMDERDDTVYEFKDKLKKINYKIS
jgi:hypothetical protein